MIELKKYELNGNIIKTTDERYERTFKALGYKPVKEPKKTEELKAEPEGKKTEKDK